MLWPALTAKPTPTDEAVTMTRTRQRIRVPVEFDHWIEGLDRFDPSDEILDQWQEATQRFYGHSQEEVHVITNALRSSGRYSTNKHGHDRVEGVLEYGNTPECDYAEYEQERGGSHAFITLVFARTKDDYERALAAGIEDHVRKFL